MDDDLLCEPGLIKEHLAGHYGAEPVVLVGPVLVAPDSGRTHADLTTLADSELSDEAAGSAQDLTALLGKHPVSFAYPFGAYNEAARRCAESAFDLAFSCDEGLNDICTDPYLVRRTMVQPGDFVVDIESRVRLGWSPIERARRRLRLRTRLARVSKSVRNIYP